MNPKLLKDLILAGHRVACKTKEWQWKVFLFVNWDGKFQWTNVKNTIESCLFTWLSHTIYDDWWLWEYFTWEYKVVTPLPQLPQPWDTVEVLEICRELPWFDEFCDNMKDMVWKKLEVRRITTYWDIQIYTTDEKYYYTFSSRQVAKCEPENVQSIQSEEKLWDTIVVNWRTYQAI